MATASYKLQTFDTTNNRPKLQESNALEIILKEVEVADLGTPTNYSAANDKITTHLAGIDAALATAGGSSFADNIFEIYDDATPSKKLNFQLSGISASTTRVITMPDADVDLGKVLSAIQKDGSIAYTANQPMGGFKLTGLAAGSSAGDSVRYEQAILISGANAFAANQPMGGFKLTGLGAGSAAGDSVRYEQVILVNGANTYTANQPMGNNKLTGLAAGTAAGDSVRYEQAILTSGVNAFSANQSMGGNKLTSLAAATANGDAVRYEQAVLINGANAFTANQSMGGFKLTNLADPTAGTDAVNLNYLSARLMGLLPKQSVLVATTAAITLSGEQTIDGVLTSSSRVLVKNQAAPENNGIYVSNSSGWTRASDFDSLSPIDEINGSWVAVQQGTANTGKVFVQYGTVATLGTDPINFEYFNPLASLIGGDMITFTGSVFSVDLATNAGLVSTNPGNNAGQLQVNDDNSTLERASNVLRVKDAGITAAKLAAAVAGNGLANSGTALDVQTDGVSTEIVSDQVAIKFAETLTNADASTAAIRDIVYLSSAGNVMRAQANGSYNLGTKFGVAKAAISASASGEVYTRDGALIPGFSGLTVGSPVYVSRSAAGGFTQSLSGFVAGEHIVQIGVAKSSTVLELNPKYIAEF